MSDEKKNGTAVPEGKTEPKTIIRFVVYSLIGIFMFFIPIAIGGKKTIPLDHIVGLIQKIPYYAKYWGLFALLRGRSFSIYNRFIEKDQGKNSVFHYQTAEQRE